MANNEINGDKKYTSNAGNFDGHADTLTGTMQGTSPNGAHPWLHVKPLDAAMGQVPAPYCPGGRHG